MSEKSRTRAIARQANLLRHGPSHAPRLIILFKLSVKHFSAVWLNPHVFVSHLWDNMQVLSAHHVIRTKTMTRRLEPLDPTMHAKFRTISTPSSKSIILGRSICHARRDFRLRASTAPAGPQARGINSEALSGIFLSTSGG